MADRETQPDRLDEPESTASLFLSYRSICAKVRKLAKEESETGNTALANLIGETCTNVKSILDTRDRRLKPIAGKMKHFPLLCSPMKAFPKTMRAELERVGLGEQLGRINARVRAAEDEFAEAAEELLEVATDEGWIDETAARNDWKSFVKEFRPHLNHFLDATGLGDYLDSRVKNRRPSQVRTRTRERLLSRLHTRLGLKAKRG